MPADLEPAEPQTRRKHLRKHATTQQLKVVCYRHNITGMWFRKPTLRRLISAFVALVFAVAVVPGSMAMPAPQSAKHQSMDCMAKTAPDCDHMKPVKEQGAPCKNMQVCMGMLGCFGMAAVVIDS